MSRKYNYILSNNKNADKSKQMVMIQYKISDPLVVNDVDLVSDFSDVYISEDISLSELSKIAKQLSHKDVCIRQYKMLSDEEFKVWKKRLNN